MASKVTHAPQEVIDELDTAMRTLAGDGVYELFRNGQVLDANDFDVYKNNSVAAWVYSGDVSSKLVMRELAVINHLLKIERLQPERETRYYVEFIGTNDISWEVRSSNTKSVGVFLKCEDEFRSYEQGITHDLAVKAQALYGGEIKEIK